MFAYIARRFAQGLIVLLFISFISFTMFQYLGDPVITLAGQYATQQQQAEVRRALGLDQPIYVQYLIFLKNAVHGDFGLSYVSRVPVLGLIFERLPASIELATTATLMAILLSLIFGVIASLRPESALSRLIMAGSLFGISVPTFLIGTLLILTVAVTLHLLPPFGRGDVVRIVGSWRTGLLTVSGLRHLILPAISLSLFELAVLLRLTRSGMVEVLGEDYIKTAWAKGLPARVVIFKHALRNVLIPVVTMMGLQFGELIAYSIVTESIFQWPGAGNLILSAIYESDRPVIVAYVMIVAFTIVLINLVIDLLYGVLNPKICYD